MTTPSDLQLGNPTLVNLAHRSHAVIVEHQHANGAYPASPTFSAYRGFAWLRDSGFTAEGVSRYGDIPSAGAFHDWACRVLVARTDQVDELIQRSRAGETIPVAEMLPTRFTLEGANGSDPWWDFQTDGYGIWLWSVVTHASRHRLSLERWRPGIQIAVDYLCEFWDHPCYDWWEEHVEHRHVSTLGAIFGGLSAVGATGLLSTARATLAAETAHACRELVLARGVAAGHLTKWVGTDDVDGSLPACIVPFGLLQPGEPLATETLRAVADHLDTGGGVHRFREDVFYGGGQWPLLSALLGWNLARSGDTYGAVRHLVWVAQHADDAGELPEQASDELLHPDSRAEWVQRWGDVATPLLWSHGMYLILVDELGLIQKDQPE